MIRISSVLFYRVAADKVKVTVQSTDNTKLYVYGISVIPAGLYINIMIIDGSIRVLGIIGHKSKRVPKQVCSIGN